jgi:hypothetical protein
MRRLLLSPLWLMVIALVAVACSSSNPSPEGDGAATDVAVDPDAEPADETTAADDRATTEAENAASSGQPVPGFDYSTVEYGGPAQESALRGDRAHPSFPPPVIDPSLIRSGGPPPDGIFPIDAPTYAPIDELDYEIADDEAVIAVEVDGDARAFPVQIMIWHEIVNTEIGGTPVTVTYCPLCNSAISYDRRFGDQILDFGTSGELYQSALVMYDRQTESLWAHFTGQGLVGHLAGAELDLIPTQTVSWGAWKDAHPDGQVLTRSLGAPPRYLELYGSNPYAGYDFEELDPFGMFFVGEIDRTLAAKARIVGVADDQGSVAVRYEDLETQPVIPVIDGNRDLVVFYQPGLASSLDSFSVADGRDVGQTGVFVPRLADGTSLTFTAQDGGFVDDQTGSRWNILGRAVAGAAQGETLQSVVHTDTFWFAWATYRPGTVLVAP